MMIEPLPIFDCMYCVKNSKLIFEKMSENYLSKKYSILNTQYNNPHNNVLDSPLPHHLLSIEIDDDKINQFLKSKSTFKILEIDEGEIEENAELEWLNASIKMQFMLDRLPIEKKFNGYQNLSPIARKVGVDTALLTNLT